MAILKADKTTKMNSVTVNEYLLTKHNPNKIDMPTHKITNLIGITVHNTDRITVASNTTPAEQYTRATVNGNMKDVRVHFYVDDVCAWQCLPLDLSGWHATDGSGDGNRKTISIECIMNGSGDAKDKKAEGNCAKLVAYLLDKYKLKDTAIYSHNHWYKVKYCPAYILPHWNNFKKKVISYRNKNTAIEGNSKPSNSVKALYRVRVSWDNAKSQIGAFSSLENAKKACKTGYFVFDANGKVVYPVKKSVTEIAKEVIQGKWGNGTDRKNRLEKAGYNYNEVQKKVNMLLK